MGGNRLSLGNKRGTRVRAEIMLKQQVKGARAIPSDPIAL
jgi:hypothetical protein